MPFCGILVPILSQDSAASATGERSPAHGGRGIISPMQSNRTVSEELAFKAAELDAALQEAGFHLAYTDPEAARDFAYRARYLRGKSTLFPLLNASVEYYHATKRWSIKISASEEWEN